MLPFSRASGIIDVVVFAMVGVIGALLISVFLVRARRAYQAHKRFQIALAVALTLILGIFETHVRMVDWRPWTEGSPYSKAALDSFLTVHITIATVTTVIWIWMIWKALRAFSNPPRPGPHSASHKRWAKWGTTGMIFTVLTGWTFYWMAFVAS